MNSLDILCTLVHRLEGRHLCKLGVIPWAAPVLSFGNPSRARVATLGLNPSNREFVDLAGNELIGDARRFHTLTSLGLKRWSDATDHHLALIQESCDNYFIGNPYDGWFHALDKLIMGTHASYYGLFSEACHLDLVPYATACKWTELSSSQRTELLNSVGNALGWLLCQSHVEVLVVNGQSVIEYLQLLGQCKFVKTAIPDWTLPRRSNSGVTGYAYTGKLSEVSGVDLGREVSILGYSHNIQSSFGVTTNVRSAIQKWIAHGANEVFC